MYKIDKQYLSQKGKKYDRLMKTYLYNCLKENEINSYDEFFTGLLECLPKTLEFTMKNSDFILEVKNQIKKITSLLSESTPKDDFNCSNEKKYF